MRHSYDVKYGYNCGCSYGYNYGYEQEGTATYNSYREGGFYHNGYTASIHNSYRKKQRYTTQIEKAASLTEWRPPSFYLQLP